MSKNTNEQDTLDESSAPNNSVAEEMSAYEVMVTVNIARNQQQFNALGLESARINMSKPRTNRRSSDEYRPSADDSSSDSSSSEGQVRSKRIPPSAYLISSDSSISEGQVRSKRIRAKPKQRKKEIKFED